MRQLLTYVDIALSATEVSIYPPRPGQWSTRRDGSRACEFANLNKAIGTAIWSERIQDSKISASHYRELEARLWTINFGDYAIS